MNAPRLARRLLLAWLPLTPVHAALAGDDLEAPAHREALRAEVEPTTAEGWLHRLEALARERGGLDARLRYTTVQGLLDDEQVRYGRLRQASDPPDASGGGTPHADRFRIDLDGEVVDGTLRRLDRTLVWDGERLLDADALSRRVSVRTLEDQAELAETLPIPMRVDAHALLERYDAELLAAEPDDPPGSVHLRLRERDAADADPLEVWFDRTTGLPLRGRSGRSGGDTQTVDLVDPEGVAAFEPGLFDTAPPTGPGWTVEAPGSPAEDSGSSLDGRGSPADRAAGAG